MPTRIVLNATYDELFEESPEQGASLDSHQEQHDNTWATYSHHHLHELTSAQSAPRDDGLGRIVCDPAKFYRFCEENADLPHKVALVEVDEFGPKRIFVALSHGADRIGPFSMSDILRRILNSAVHPNKFPFIFEAVEGGDAADREWEKATFGEIPRAHCRPKDPFDFESNKETLLNEKWCQNTNAMCRQDSRPWRSADYALSTVCDGLPCGEVIIVETYKTGKLIEDYLPLFCAYATHHRMHRKPRLAPIGGSDSQNSRRLMGPMAAVSGGALREIRAFLPIVSVIALILALLWMIRKRVKGLQRQYDAVNKHEEIALV